MKYNFDQIIDRRNTGSAKYDLWKSKGMPEDIIPLWVADMDFPVADGIRDALHSCIDHGIFGYIDAGESYLNAVQKWYKTYFGFDSEKEWIVRTPGVVVALVLGIRAFTQPGDAVLIQQPVYYPFKNSIVNNGRRLINSPLLLQDGKYTVDFEDFERKIQDNNVRMFILCSPHNPVGRVWKKEELSRMANICLKHNVIILADEIHSDFIYPGHAHTMLGTLGEEVLMHSVICTAPSKTFNLAGLQTSNIFIADDTLRARYLKEYDSSGYDELNLMGQTACRAAYETGREWLDELKVYLKANLDFMRDFLNKHIPQARVIEPEGTYLVWVDFSFLGLSDAQLDDFMIQKAKAWLDGGTMFGESGSGFQRFNIACPRSILEKALLNIADACKNR